MADSNLGEKGKELTQLMIQTMNQELEEEAITHEKLLEQINNLVLARRQEEQKKPILLHQININVIQREKKKENFKMLLMTSINLNKYALLKQQINSEDINLLSSHDKEQLLRHGVEQFSQKGVLILLDFFAKDMSIEIKKEIFIKALLTKRPHPEQHTNRWLLYSGRFLHDFLVKSDLPQTSLQEIFPSNIAQEATQRISRMNTEQTIKVPRQRRVQSS